MGNANSVMNLPVQGIDLNEDPGFNDTNEDAIYE